MEPNLRDVAEEVEREKLREIRLAKIQEISKAWDDLFFILAGTKSFEKFKGGYSSFEKSMRQSFKEIEYNYGSDESIRPSSSAITGRLGKLLSVDYVPPQDGKRMASDLIQLGEYYLSDSFVLSIEMVLDLSLCKLIGKIKEICAIEIQKGKRDLERTMNSSIKQKKNMEKKEEYIANIFPHVIKKVLVERKTVSVIALAIKKDWEAFPPKDQDIRKAPGITFISNILKKSGKFKQTGGLWILKT